MFKQKSIVVSLITLLILVGCSPETTTTRGVYQLEREVCFLDTNEFMCKDIPLIKNYRDTIEVYKHKEKRLHKKTFRYIATSLLEHIYNRSFLITGYVDEIPQQTQYIDRISVISCDGWTDSIYVYLTVSTYIGPERILIQAELDFDASHVNNICREKENKILQHRITIQSWYEKTKWYRDDKHLIEEDKEWIYNTNTYLPLKLFDMGNFSDFYFKYIGV